MPIKKSSKKDVLRIERNTAINRAGKSKAKTAEKKAFDSINLGDEIKAQEDVKSAEKQLQTQATKKILQRKAASRRISRLVQEFKKKFGKTDPSKEKAATAA